MPALASVLVAAALFGAPSASALQLVVPAVAHAQAAPSSPYASRPLLQATLDSAERAAGDASLDRETRARLRAEAIRLRRRLQEGDFSPGDRVVVTVDGHPTLSDTFAIRTGPQLELRELPALPLGGVLRAELESHLTRHLAQFVREPRVRALPLVRVAVVGQVQRPGFITIAPDALLSDVIMQAGGPTPEADLRRTSVRRGNEVRVSEADTRVAIRDGWSLDRLDVRAGDEVVVERRRSTNWNQIVTTTIMAVGAIATVVALTR